MRRKKVYHSLKFRLFALSGVLIFAIGFFLTLNYHAGISTIRMVTCEAMKKTLSLYRESLEQNMRGMSLYLTEYVTNNNEDVMVFSNNRRHTTEWGIAASHIQKRFATAQAIYPSDGFFLYVPENGTFMASVSPMYAPKNNICSSIDSGEWKNVQNAGKWILLDAEKGYLFRAVQVFGGFVGTWISVSQYLDDLCKNTETSRFYLSDDDGRLLGTALSVNRDLLPGRAADPYAFAEIEGERYLVIAEKLDFCELFLLTLIPEAEIQKAVHPYLSTMVLTIALAVLIFGLFIGSVRRWLIVPINRLTEAIHGLQEGNWETKVRDEQSYTEFQMVNHAFNEMVSHVQALKISVYEEQLNLQRLEQEYLRRQIAPHFLINCLNTIYHLTDTNHLKLAQQMAQEMSQYIRFALTVKAFEPLRSEIEIVENYVRLSNIRYADAIQLWIQIDPSLYECSVIPFLLLNFVENTVKHEAQIGHLIEIHIGAETVAENGQEQLAFSIWDTGRGFDERFLAKIRDIDAYVENSDGHLGIENVYKRARLLLGDCTFRFSNRPNAGAQIDIRIPKRMCESEKGDNP